LIVFFQVAVVAEYKQINSQLGDRLEKMTTRIHTSQSECCADCQKFWLVETAENASVLSAVNGRTPSEDDRITHLELELARTKLALVEKECYTQELLHQLSLASNANPSDQPNKNNWLSKTIKSAAIKTQAALVGANSTSNLGNREVGERRPIRTDSATSQ
jgi:hypothetical protein